jgi:hypothetical protein
MSSVWFVTMGGGTNRWCMVCMGNEVETKSLVVFDKTNGRWEL